MAKPKANHTHHHTEGRIKKLEGQVKKLSKEVLDLQKKMETHDHPHSH